MTPEPVEPQTAADICQLHLERLSKYKKGDRFQRGLLGAVASAVCDLLILTRNTDIAGRANRAELDRHLAELRDHPRARVTGSRPTLLRWHKFVASLRGFDNPDEHDAWLAEKWDRVVNPDGNRQDQVWVLGDISAGGNRAQLAALGWLMQRPGTKHLIVGNHDGAHPMFRDSHKWQSKYLGVFDSVQAFARRKVAGQSVLLSHFPYQGSEFADHTSEERYPQWRLPDMGEWLVHGHVHDTERVRGRSVHVGVDAWEGQLVPLEVLEGIVRNQPATP